jgi:carbonic anhydrase
LPPKETAIDSPVKPLFKYDEINPDGSSSDITEEKTTPLKIKYEDWAIRIKHKIFGKLVTFDGGIYFAEEIVFHTPAEHTINGQTFDMEMQIIHYGKTKGDIAKQVVLSFLFKKQPGVFNKFLDDLDFFNLPDPLMRERNINTSIYIPKIFYNAADDEFPLIKPFSFYTYQGSLTNPPCTQRTVMYVASKPLPIGTTVLRLFEEAIRHPDLMDTKGNVIISKILPENNRKLQALNGRAIFYYDHIKYCGPDPIKKPVKPKGHYEKSFKKFVDYFFVGGEKPSGLPGAFVVSSKEALGNMLK